MHSGHLIWSKGLSNFCISINFGVKNKKKWLHLLLCNFSSRWNNSTLYKNFGDSFKQLRTTPSYLQNQNLSKNFMEKYLLKKAKMLKFNDKNLFASSIHPYLLDPSIWILLKIKCNWIKYIFFFFFYNVIVTLGFANLGKILMLILIWSINLEIYEDKM